MKKKAIYSLLVIVFLLTFNVSIVSAAEFLTADKGGNISVGSDETIKNLYTAGNIVTIDGNIEKSLHAVGNVVTVSGDVESDLCAGGSTILVKGSVGGTIHAAGGTVIIEGAVTDDLFIFGGNLVLTKSGSVGGDLISAGGTIDIQGPVAGKLNVTGGQVTINSKIGGETKINAQELRLGSDAEITQDLTYKAEEEAEIDEAATILGTIDFTKSEVKKQAQDIKFKAKGAILGILTIGFLIKILISIVSGLVLIYLFGKLIKPVVKESLRNFWPSLGIGFAALILTPIAGLLFAVTILGLGLAGLLMIVYGLLLALAKPLAAIAFGTWLIRIFKKKNEKEIGWQEVVLGVIVLSIISLIPIIGWLAWLVMFLITLGALFRLTYKEVIAK